MRNFYPISLSFCLLFLVGLSGLQGADREVIIEPVIGEINLIENFVEADLAANDTATVASTVYILRRDAIYPYQTMWQPSYPVTLVAEEGEGKRPRMLPINVAAGEAPRFFRPTNSFTVVGIEFDGLDSAGEHTDNAPIRPRGENTRIWVEDCLIDFQRYEVMRTDNANQVVYFINNIVRNNYQRDLWHKTGGVARQRGNVIDTIVMNHNTFFNTTGYLTEFGNAAIGYMEFNNNTIVNTGGLIEYQTYPPGEGRSSAMLELGEPYELNVQNNLFYNIGFFGTRVEWDTFTCIFAFYPSDSVEAQLPVISNNNIYTDPDLLEGTPDTAVQIKMYNEDLDSLIQAEPGVWTNNISEALEFANAPMNKEAFIAAKALRWSDPNSVFDQILDLDGWVDRTMAPPADYLDTYDADFAYSENSASATAGVNGGPLGSRRWMSGVFTNTREFKRAPELMTLRSNFPNPFVGSTTIRLDLARAAKVTVRIYDLTGKVVAQFGQEQMAAGEGQQIQLNGLNLSTGVYGYQVFADMGDRKVSASGRMVVK